MKANLVNDIYVDIYFRPFLNCLDADDPYLARKLILRDKTLDYCCTSPMMINKITHSLSVKES